MFLEFIKDHPVGVAKGHIARYPSREAGLKLIETGYAKQSSLEDFQSYNSKTKEEAEKKRADAVANAERIAEENRRKEEQKKNEKPLAEQVEVLNSHIVELESESKSLKEENSILAENNSVLKEEVFGLVETVEKSENVFKTLNETIDKNAETIGAISDDKDQLTKAKDNAVREGVELKSDLSKANVKIVSLEKEIKELKKAKK